jgi:hypothetical protein
MTEVAARRGRRLEGYRSQGQERWKSKRRTKMCDSLYFCGERVYHMKLIISNSNMSTIRFPTKGDSMAFTKEIGLITAGFVLGTVGVKALTSEPAKRLCVQAVSKGLQAKAVGQDIIEQAKSNVDDIVAEATYLNEQEEKEAKEPGKPTVRTTRKTTGKK